MVKKSKRAFRTISEAAGDLDVPQHVLRFWETKFTAIKPMKRGGNRRFYRPGDIFLLKAIKHHLYDQEQSIKVVQQLIKDGGAKSFVEDWKAATGVVEEVDRAPKPEPVMVQKPEPEAEPAPEPTPEPVPGPVPEPTPEPAAEPVEPGLMFEPEAAPDHEIEPVPEEKTADPLPSPDADSDDDSIKISKDLVRALVNDLRALRSLIDRLPD